MRRIAILVGAVALMTMLFAGVAFARNFQCTTYPCYGTNNDDQIFERGGSIRDLIYAGRGDDSVDATLFGGDRDRLFGQRGDDDLNADDGDGRDQLSGGPGLDVCAGDFGDTFGVSCEVVIKDGVLVRP